MKTSFLTMIIFFSLTSHSVTQDFEKHRWKDRLLVLHARSFSSPELLEQLDILHLDTAGLKERKLVVYQIVGKAYKTGISSSGTVQTFHNSIQPDSGEFTIRLIGLDGGVKLEKHHPVPLEVLFTLIDGMPMRRAEVKRKRKDTERDN